MVYPLSPYNISTTSTVDIACVFSNPPPYDLSFSITPPLPIPLIFHSSNANISGKTNFSSISSLTTYTVIAYTFDFPNIATTTLVISVNFLPTFFYPSFPSIFQIDLPLTIAPIPTFSNIPGIIYTLISSPALTEIGLILDTISGTISGIPNKATNIIEYIVRANNNGLTFDASLNISIQTIPTFSYSQSSFILTQNNYISILPTVLPGEYIYSTDCILPFGLSLNSETGEISGSPSILSTFFTYPIKITNVIGSSITVITLSVIKEFLAPPVVADNFSSNTFLTDPIIAMRRKAEIFKYKKNSSNLTKQQYFSLLAKGNGPASKRSWGTQSVAYTNPNESGLPQSGNTIICNSGIVCAPTSSSDVPGPIVDLCYNPAAPLVGYNQPNRKRVNIGFKWPQQSWQVGANGFPVGKAGFG